MKEQKKKEAKKRMKVSNRKGNRKKWEYRTEAEWGKRNSNDDKGIKEKDLER